jgi:Fe-S-cluster-containing hydrogenase component 2
VPKYHIHIFSERCSGCQRCQLACSDLFSKVFDPSRARIHVVLSGADCSIELAEDCNGCGVCVDHCFFGAVEKERREARR